MGASRESADVFSTAVGFRYGVWKRLFTKHFWQNEHLWHDTFGKRWVRLTGCKHPKLQLTSDRHEKEEWHCFNCETTVQRPAGAAGYFHCDVCKQSTNHKGGECLHCGTS